jgi:tetratricopeptide (TPR) repeat protein
MVMLNKTWFVICLAVLVTSLFVFAMYGKPFLNRNITEGLLYSTAAQRAGVSDTWIQICTIINRISEAAFLGGILVLLYVEYLLRRTVSRLQIKKFRLFLKMCISIEFVAVCGWCFLALMRFFKMQSLPVSPFSEYLRFYFIWEVFLALVSIGLLSGGLALWFFTAGDNIYRTARDNSLGNYTALIHRNEIEAAEEALIAASEMDKEGVVSLAVRAVFCDVFLSARSDAMRHLEAAAENLKKVDKIKDEDMATYEFCIGNILLNKNEYTEAIEHLKRSLELNYNAERKAFLKKVQLLEQNEKQEI